MIYYSNSKRPHTVIKNMLYDLKGDEKKIITEFLKRIIDKVNYFSLQEIDFSILRLFVLRKLSRNKEEFTIDSIEYLHFENEYLRYINNILKSFNKKYAVISFLDYLAHRKEYAIELQILEKKDDKDLIYILTYCEI